jgi:ABC-type transporter Mla MlaB component
MKTKGFFKIRRSDSKVALKLKGNFDTDNICWINHVLINRKFFHSKFLELDMSEAGNINARTLAILASTLNKLRERGVTVKVTDHVGD